MNPSKNQIEPGTTTTRAQVALSLLPAKAGVLSGEIGGDVGCQRAPGGTLGMTPSRSPTLPNNRLVEKLAQSPIFLQFRRVFEGATGLPLTLRAIEGWQLAHRSSRLQNAFCALLYQKNRSCAECLQSQQRVCGEVNGAPSTLSCSFGLAETAVAVRSGPELIAYLQTGQVFFKPPTPQQTRRALQQIEQWELDLDRAEAARRYHETPVVLRSTYLAHVGLLQFFADQLGATANQILVQQQSTEPVQISRARQFIDEHYREDLSLATVSGQVGMSTFYFCKKFKQVTGMSFTRYVSCIRVEEAKHLLLNRNYRVSETAFEVGCQSLSHFNRIFKSIAGYSPTEFRRRLPAA